MDESQIHVSIEKLVAEEHELWGRESDGSATDDDRRRLEQIRLSLDQCWDFLRQRRARRDAGQDRTLRPPDRPMSSRATSNRAAGSRSLFEFAGGEPAFWHWRGPITNAAWPIPS